MSMSMSGMRRRESSKQQQKQDEWGYNAGAGSVVRGWIHTFC
jgi:hypothetical protein